MRDEIVNSVLDVLGENLNTNLHGGYLVTKTVDGAIVKKFFYLSLKDWNAWANEMMARDGFEPTENQGVKKDKTIFDVTFVQIPDVYYYLKELFNQ